MIRNHTNSPGIDPHNLRPHKRQPLPNIHHPRDQLHLRPHRHRPQVCHIQMPTDPSQLEKPWLRHPQQDHRRERVEERRCAPAVQVAEVVAVLGGDGQQEGDFGVWFGGSGVEC